MQLPIPLLFLMTPAVHENKESELLTPVSRDPRSESCCFEDHLLECQHIDIQPGLLIRKKEIKILGISFTFSNHIAPHGFVYMSQAGDEAVITYNDVSRNMFGGVKTREGKSFAIEKCEGGHVVKEYDVKSFNEDQGIPSPEDAPIIVPPAAQDKKDSKTILEYSVMLYYTTEVKKNVADLEGFFNQILAETNQGYRNSDIPVRLTKFCSEEATLEELPDAKSSFSVLSAFRNMKGSDSALRNTADAAALITWTLPGCGVGYLYSYENGLSFSVTKKSCAAGYYSFGHELAHNFGCHHNREVATNTRIPYGHGFLIKAGNKNSGVRTILAYNREGHNQRVNYYSNPAIKYPPTGTLTGSYTADNAWVFVKNRWSFTSIGNESAECFDPEVSSTTTTTTTTTTSTTSTSTTTTTATTLITTTNNLSVEGAHLHLPSALPECLIDGINYFGVVKTLSTASSDPCRRECNHHPECQYWRWRKDFVNIEKSKCWLIRVASKRSEAYAGFESGQKHCIYR